MKSIPACGVLAHVYYYGMRHPCARDSRKIRNIRTSPSDRTVPPQESASSALKGVVAVAGTDGPETSVAKFFSSFASETDLDKRLSRSRPSHRTETAKTFGITTDSFLFCPVDFKLRGASTDFSNSLRDGNRMRETAAPTICDPSLMRIKPENLFSTAYTESSHGVLQGPKRTGSSPL